MSSQPIILYVDDEPINLSNFSSTFGDEFSIATASSGEEAMEFLSRESGVAVVVADQRMSGMTGIDLLFNVKNTWPSIIRMMLTAFSDSDDLIDAINRGGVSCYIVKPWDEQALRLSLRNSLKISELAAKNIELVQELESRNAELLELNANLENKIANRTRELHLTNRMLLEKNEQLLQAHITAARTNRDLQQLNETLEIKIKELEQAENTINALRSILPICSYCKKIRDEQSAWHSLESYMLAHSDISFSHSICPECYNTHIIKEIAELGRSHLHFSSKQKSCHEQESPPKPCVDQMPLVEPRPKKSAE